MSLNKQKGNMYPWVTHTWNVIKGKCPHDCPYCYMKIYPQKNIRFDESELQTDLGFENIIFVGSSCDMWAESISIDWIKTVIQHCESFPHNVYLFQSKNPERFFEVIDDLPITFQAIFGTTLETNRDTYTNAPEPSERIPWMWELTDQKYRRFKRMISIEPVMDFDLVQFSMGIRNIHPNFVSIGADSKGHNLQEPNKEKTLELITRLKTFTEVKIKDNLKRILN